MVSNYHRGSPPVAKSRMAIGDTSRRNGATGRKVLVRLSKSELTSTVDNAEVYTRR